MPQGPLPGFRDFYPPELAERAHLMNVWRDVARRFAFVEYDGPPLEPLELYTKKSGEEIVAQLYTFTDKGGREVALRPEMTPTFARMVAAKVQALRKPVRWFSTPQLFRYERQQKGRLREHFQLNVDIVGEADVAADAELLAVAIEVMRGCGLGSADVVARVSDRRLLNAILDALGLSDERSVAYSVLDKLHREPREALALRLTGAGVSAEAANEVLALSDIRSIAGLREWSARHAGAAGDNIGILEEYLALVSAHGVGDWVRLDLSIVRGLAYYTGIVFELFDAQGELRAICGGGRYDDLLAAVGGPALPALGFGMGDVVLTELLRARGLMPRTEAKLDIWIAAADAVPPTAVIKAAAMLRDAGRSVEYSLRPQQLSRQLKNAGAAGARLVVILRDADDVTVRRMADGEERVMRLADLLDKSQRPMASGQ
jgi:histidyl-tRNA synthetase